MAKLSLLHTKSLLLGITGGVAAYKAAEIARILVQENIDVQTVMTESACRFIGPTTLQALTGKTVYTDLWDNHIANNMAHINISRDVNAILIAPASANFIAKLANGFADDLLSTLCLARNCPLFIAPAMNRQMWRNSATQRNLFALQRDGVTILGPAEGAQACGETGMGRMLEAQELVKEIQAFFQPKLLQNKHVLITAGPTYEAIDAVRGITNLSSGKMGYAMANAALEAGAKVTLISGPTCLEAPSGAILTNVTSTQEMLAVVKKRISGTDIFISVAAVADFFPAKISKQKIKKTSENISLTLAPNPDILEFVTKLAKPPFCVGFAAETENLEKNAETKRRKKKIPLLAANLVPNAISADESELILLDDKGKYPLPRAPKIVQARHIIKHISLLYNKWKN
jgi:phosphopantothenoylcysteine decarboxylase/phosphopantothenate--cysteine ligase